MPILFAKDYVEGMWRIVQHQTPDDYVLATGVTTKIRDFAIKCFSYLGIEVEFSGEGANEIAKVVKCNGDYKLSIGEIVIAIDPRYYRPTEVDLLIGDSSKARKELNWEPKYNLDGLVNDMMKADLELFTRERFILKGGYKGSEIISQ